MKLQTLSILLLTALLGLTACSEDVPLPEATPLQIPPETMKTLYAAKAGPFQVKQLRDQVLPAANSHRQLDFNLYYPTTGKNHPLVIFSHGNWSNKDSYDRLIEHWVSHGYVVIAPNHLDCCSMAQGIFNSVRYGQLGLIEARVEDFSVLLKALDKIAAMQPQLADKIDIQHIAMAGHSFGAFTATQLGGAAALDPDEGVYRAHLNPQISAVIALSNPGPMFDTITADSWLELQTPTLFSTGTWDIQPAFWPDWRDHLLAFETAKPGDKYALVIDGADHYLGNLICRLEREEPPQTDALAMVNITTTAFLDAYLKKKPEARDFISANHLGEVTGGFARLSQR